MTPERSPERDAALRHVNRVQLDRERRHGSLEWNESFVPAFRTAGGSVEAGNDVVEFPVCQHAGLSSPSLRGFTNCERNSGSLKKLIDHVQPFFVGLATAWAYGLPKIQ